MDKPCKIKNQESRIENRWRLGALFFSYALLIFLRCPKIILEGRFWAEEGKYYFLKAASMNFWEALLSPQMGYYSLVPNVATLFAARNVSLAFAPHVTVAFAFLIQLLPAVFILFGKIDFLKSFSAKIWALALVLFTLPNQQIWLNTISSHFYLCLCAGLILISEPETKIREFFKNFILLIAGLTGVVSTFLTPFFWCKAIVEKSRTRFVQAGVLTLCALAQGAVIFSHLGSSRSLGFYGDVWISAFFAKTILLPLTGISVTGQFCNQLRSNLQNGIFPWILLFVLLFYWGIVAYFIGKSKISSARYLFQMAFFVLALSLLGAYESGTKDGMLIHISAIFCGRYYYAPNVFLALSLLALAFSSAFHVYLKYALNILLFWMMVVGVWNFFWTKSNYFSSGAKWGEEIQIWKKNPTHPLQFWPADPWWSISLSAREKCWTK
ncbi:MAG: hypothetical protein ACOY3I_05290 [Verrucomicrobiota bacterium]